MSSTDYRMHHTFKPYTQTDVVSFYKELVKRWADDQLDQLEEYSDCPDRTDCTDRKELLESLIDSSLQVFKDDILDEIESRF